MLDFLKKSFDKTKNIDNIKKLKILSVHYIKIFFSQNFNNVTTLSTNKIIHKIDSLIYLNKEINK